MEEEGIEAVLAKAIELRFKVVNCIQRASNSTTDNKPPSFGKINGVEQNGFDVKMADSAESVDGEGLDEEAEQLLHIRDALEALEHQLSNLQDLQQQQRYEKEVALSEIEHSRKILLDKLKDYRGQELDIIQQASAFAAETVEHKTDLLLPPYPNRPPHSLVADSNNHHRKLFQNGVAAAIENNEPHNRHSRGWCNVLAAAAAKTVITTVGVVSVLAMSGYGTKIGIGSNGFLKTPGRRNNGLGCPVGRVLVMEDGEARCVVKERVAVPFESVTAKPDVNYGSG